MKKQIKTCRACGCTDDDCRQCIERTGQPCYWVEVDLCSACVPREPETIEEWQEAANLAEFYLLVHSAQCYGLVTFSGEIDVERCEHILHQAAQRNIKPAPDSVEQLIAAHTN